jgi:site-specific DNA-methyltransferase (adenine-specific)
MEAGRVDHCITDPPYSAYVHNKSRAGARVLDESGYRCDFSRAVDFGFDPLTEAVRSFVCSIAALVGRWTLVFSDVESAHLWRIGLEAEGLDYIRTGVWVKLDGTPQFTGDRPGVGFETVTIAHHAGKKRWNGGGMPALWSCAVVKNHPNSASLDRQHPTQKPLPLMRTLVEQFTDPGDVVLDPFMGSGTTGVACKELGRSFIGIEMNPDYFAIAKARIEAARYRPELVFTRTKRRKKEVLL